MVLKLTVYVRNAIFFFYRPTIQWNSDIKKKMAYVFDWKLAILRFGHVYDVVVT